MYKSPLKLVTLLIIGLMLSACSHTVPIMKVDNVLVPQGLTQNQVKKAIIAGCADKNWYATEKQPGLIIATLNYRGTYVKVEIPYTDKNYSINYVESTKLNAEDGQISYYYTRWVTFLNQKIQARLMEASQLNRSQSK